MSHYHFLAEKTVVSDVQPKSMTNHYIVAKDFANQEAKIATEMGYSLKHNECFEPSCFKETAKT